MTGPRAGESGARARASGWSVRAAALGGAVAALAALALHLASTPYDFVYDDGAIALRYSLRIAAGEGFSYGGGERVHGASPVLAVVTSAGLLALGLDLATTVRVIAGACLSLAAGGLAFAALRRFGPATALFGVGLLVATGYHLSVLHDGLEAPFLLALMVALWAALDVRRPVLHGVLLGLLVQNKLDAALAAVVYAADHVARERRFPWRATIVALLVCVPMAAWLLASVGTVLPHAGLTKVTTHVNRGGFDPAWMANLTFESAWLALPVAGLGVVWALAGRRLERTTTVLAGWAALHLAFYSAVDMGDTFRWYAAQPIFAAMLLAVEAVGRLERRIAAAGRPRLAAVPALALLGVFAIREGAPTVGAALTRSPQGVELPKYQHANLALQAAGAWLRAHSSGTERLAVTHGFPALEYGGPVLDMTGLNSSRRDIETTPHAYSVTVLDPALVASTGTRSLPGYMTVASFRYGPRHEAFLVARPDSEVARAGHFAATWDPSTLTVVERVGTVAIEPNALRWSGAGRLALALPTPTPTRLALTLAADAPEGARLAVRLDGAEVGAVGPGARLDVALGQLPARGTAGADVVAIELTGVAGGTAVSVEDLVLRTGEPIRSGDLLLVSPRQAARIDAWAERGLCGRR